MDDGGDTNVCKYCGRPGHDGAICPKSHVDERNLSGQLLKEAKLHGKKCFRCAAPEHMVVHHKLAMYRPLYVASKDSPNFID